MDYSDVLTNSTDRNFQYCFHCGEPVPFETHWTISFKGNEFPMCCPGCQAVAETIIDYGLENFYSNRNSYQDKAKQILPEELQKKFSPYDNPVLQKDFVNDVDETKKQISLILEGVVCPACIWLNETRLANLDGIISVNGNYTSSRLNVIWDNSRLQLSKILQVISSLGYSAFPYNKTVSQELYKKERKSMLKRIGLAGLLGMQVMMIALALYASDITKIQSEMRLFLFWLSFLLTVPVLFYSGRPFYMGALRDIQCFRLGMDVPVTLGIFIAFFGSVYNTLLGLDHIYYDSVVMFIFFLLTGRYFEFMSRKRTFTFIDKINKIIPVTAIRISEGSSEDIIPVTELAVDDIILVRAGEVFPADGKISEGETSADESIMTGESLPQIKKYNDQVIAGSVNTDSPVKVKINAIGENTVQSRICHLIEEGQRQKAEITTVANKLAGWFVFLVLIIAGIVSWYWWHTDYEKWLPITISVLVVTCPCALSLATPTAITVATSLLMKFGIAVKHGDSIENLTRTTDFIFDKTGTLTEGIPQLIKIDCINNESQEHYHAIAVALETMSEHPLAKAICNSYSGDIKFECKNVTNKTGYGLSADIEGNRYYIGSIRYIMENTSALTNNNISLVEEDYSLVMLANEKDILCVFYLEDTVRPGARDLVEFLHEVNKNTAILSGDRQETVKKVANNTGIKNIYAELNPDEKLEIVNKYKSRNAIVAAIGDGINDAPVLASAHVSIAMGSGTDLAKLNADLILMNSRMESLRKMMLIAQNTLKIIRQNITWAISYNIVALPVAAAGLIAPWMAALGMSLSSLVVIGNAMRLSRLD